MLKTATRQQQYDRQALEALKTRFPVGYEIEGSVVTLPIPPGTPVDKLAAGSLRVSKGRDEMRSPELQWDDIAGLCKKKGLVLYRVFLDMHKTGREFEKRAVKQIAAEVKANLYKNVVLWKWSRWGRNVRWSTVYLAIVEDAGGQVFSADADIDPKTAIGKFTRTQLLAIAELESDLKSEDWKATHANRRGRGLPHTSSPRFGYRYDPENGYVVVEDQAEELRSLYEKFVKGVPMRELTRDLNHRGITTVTDREWTPTALGRMLDTGFAAGLIRERSEPPSANSKNNKSTIRNFDIWRDGGHVAIISKGLWEDYKAKRLHNATLPSRTVARYHALTGLLLCSECGSVLVTQFSEQRHVYLCGARMRAQARGHTNLHTPVTVSHKRVMAAIEAWLEEQHEGGEDVGLRVARESKPAVKPVSNLENLKARVDGLKAERLELARMKVKKQVEDEEYDALKAEVDAKIVKAEADLAGARAQTTVKVAPARAVWESLATHWVDATDVERREALDTVVSAVVVRPESASVKALIVPSWL